MEKTEFDLMLSQTIISHPGVSDLIFVTGKPQQVEAFGILKTVGGDELLTPARTAEIAQIIIGGDSRLLDDLARRGSCDCGYSLNDDLRLRVNVFKERGNHAIVMRKPELVIPSISSLGLPPIFHNMAKEKSGLILITGPTGSGKTTTMAAVLDEINASQPVHIVSLEDPIEFVHKHKQATFCQRELGADFDTFADGLRAALRQAPKVIMIGEMRDRQTVEIALNAAETGHLVLSTLHTTSAGQSINRILGMFERDEESQIRVRLAEMLRYVVCQRLVPKLSGGRHLITEIMGTSLRVREAINLGETEERTFDSIIAASISFGWETFDHSLGEAFRNETISEETTYNYSIHKGKISRIIDDIKKGRGHDPNADTSGLCFAISSPPQEPIIPPPLPIKEAKKKWFAKS